MPFSCCGKMPVCLHLQGPPPPIGPSTAFPAEAKPPETSGALPNRWIAYLTAPAGAAASGRATRSSRHSVQQKLSLPSRKANTARPASAKRGKKASGAAVAAASPARGLTGGCLCVQSALPQAACCPITACIAAAAFVQGLTGGCPLLSKGSAAMKRNAQSAILSWSFTVKDLIQAQPAPAYCRLDLCVFLCTFKGCIRLLCALLGMSSDGTRLVSLHWQA